jgi:hypothetical protein
VLQKAVLTAGVETAAVPCHRRKTAAAAVTAAVSDSSAQWSSPALRASVAVTVSNLVEAVYVHPKKQRGYLVHT